MDDHGAAKAVLTHMRALELKSGDSISAAPLQSRLVLDGFTSDDFMAAVDAMSTDGLIKRKANEDLFLTARGYHKLHR